MTVTPSLSSPNAWPLTDELADIDQKIADLQRTADQAQTSSAVAASEVASAQKAIRELSTAKAEILEKGRLWDRDAQLQRALAERKAVADRVRLALGARGSLATQRKSDLETALKAKAGIAASGNLNAVFNAAKGEDVTRQNDDNSARNEWQLAKTALANAKQDYARKAEAAEVAWAAIQNSARNLDEQFNVAQQQLAEAEARTAAVTLPPTPIKLNPAAAEAGLAWKDYVDAFDGLVDATKAASVAVRTDRGEQDLVTAWEAARDAARNALAVLLDAQKTLAEKQRIHEQRQSVRPGRSASERQAALTEVRKALTPPPSPPTPPGP